MKANIWSLANERWKERKSESFYFDITHLIKPLLKLTFHSTWNDDDENAEGNRAEMWKNATIKNVEEEAEKHTFYQWFFMSTSSNLIAFVVAVCRFYFCLDFFYFIFLFFAFYAVCFSRLRLHSFVYTILASRPFRENIFIFFPSDVIFFFLLLVLFSNSDFSLVFFFSFQWTSLVACHL